MNINFPNRSNKPDPKTPSSSSEPNLIELQQGMPEEAPSSSSDPTTLFDLEQRILEYESFEDFFNALQKITKPFFDGLENILNNPEENTKEYSFSLNEDKAMIHFRYASAVQYLTIDSCDISNILKKSFDEETTQAIINTLKTILKLRATYETRKKTAEKEKASALMLEIISQINGAVKGATEEL